MTMFPPETFFRPEDDLGSAPEAVREAFASGAEGVSYFPEGWTSYDSCGCCSTKHKPGWYQRSSSKNFLGWEIPVEEGRLTILCELDGTPTKSSFAGDDSIASCC